jgi:multiple sugar transport system permease protein
MRGIVNSRSQLDAKPRGGFGLRTRRLIGTRRLDLGPIVCYGLLIAASIFALAPIFWMLSVSLRPNRGIFSIPPNLLPPEFTTEAYARILGTPEYLRAFGNSYVVAFAVTVVSLALATLGAYGFARFEFRYSRTLRFLVIATQMVPPISLMVPYFILITTLKLYNTYTGLVLTYTAFVLPFSTLMMISYFKSIPEELEEAAMVDGCSRMGSLARIVLPIALPGIVATGVYAFLLAWNEFLFAVTLTQSVDMRLVTVALALLAGEHAYQWNIMMGFSVLASIPLLIAFLFFQRYLVSGLTVGAVKG